MEDIILKEKELRVNLTETINKSKLPAFIIKPILKDLFEQASFLEQQQYKEAKSNTVKKKGEEGINE